MIKQVIIVRKDLNMPAGKLATQVAHAAVNSVLNGLLNIEISKDFNIIYDEWMHTGYTKICLEVASKEELEKIYKEVSERNFVNSGIIIDEGRTCFKEPTATCFAVGPIDNKIINSITKKLKLYS